MKVKDLREIAKSHGLRGYSRLKKSDLIHMIGKCDTEVFGNDFLIEVSEDNCEDLPDCEELFAKKVKVFEGGLTIEVSEDNCEDLTDYEDLFAKKDKVFEGGLTIEVSEDDCEDLPDGW